MDIKCRVSGLIPNCVVIVATVRALKMHGGVGKIVAGKPLPKELIEENLPALEKGAGEHGQEHPDRPPLRRAGRRRDQHLLHGHEPRGRTAQEDRRELRRRGGGRSPTTGRRAARARSNWPRRSSPPANKTTRFEFLYPLDMPIKKKIETIATRVYGADGVDFLPVAEEKVALYEKLGYGNLPICMAKTHLSLSHIPGLEGRAEGLPHPGARHPRLRRRRVPLSVARRHAHHARPAQPPGVLSTWTWT